MNDTSFIELFEGAKRIETMESNNILHDDDYG